MRRFTIDHKEYTVEFSIEATLYNECTEKVMDMMLTAGVAQAEVESDALDAKEKTMTVAEVFNKSISDIPQRAVTLFYAGLLEHHGTESGDGTVKSKDDAKNLLKMYLKEHSDVTLYDIMSIMIDEMGKDHFFEKIGVDKVVQTMNKSIPKTPQDHKRKEDGANM